MVTNCIITTCKNRSKHLRFALESWRTFLPDWLPIVSTADDPEAVAAVRQVYEDRPHVLLEQSFDGWRKLRLLDAAVCALPDGADRVVLFDADIIAVFPTASWLARPLTGFVVPHFPPSDAYPHDFGVLLTTAPVLRKAFDLIRPRLDDWQGYGSEDMLIRAACWITTQGAIERAPVGWGHIPHGHDIRAVSYAPGTDPEAQWRENQARFDRDFPAMCEQAGVGALRSRIFADCLGDYNARRRATLAS